MNSRSVKRVQKMHGKEPTTISTWAAAVVQAVESYGCPSENLLAQAGIDDKLLSDPDARIRIEDMSRLWKLAVRMTGDACVCLEASDKEEPPSDEAFDMIMAAVVAFARILSSDAVQPVRVELMRKRPSDPEAFHRFFRSPLVFRAAYNRIFFPPDGLKTPLPNR